MSKEEVLTDVERDIAANDLGKARDRLLGLVGEYPNDLELRARLGQIYWELRYPDRAGCYWYLVEEKSEEMRVACEAFERRCGGDARTILRHLRFYGNARTVEPYVSRVISDLRERAGRPYSLLVVQPHAEPGTQKKVRRPSRLSRGLNNGCIIGFMFGFLVVFGAGVYFVMTRWVPFFKELPVDALTVLF